MPLQCHMTIPRQYIGPGGGVLLPGNSARKTMSEEFASAATLPGESRSEKPEVAKPMGRNSNRKLVLIRGNKRNKRATIGAAWARSLPVVASGCQIAPGDDPR